MSFASHSSGNPSATSVSEHAACANFKRVGTTGFNSTRAVFIDGAFSFTAFRFYTAGLTKMYDCILISMAARMGKGDYRFGLTKTCKRKAQQVAL